MHRSCCYICGCFPRKDMRHLRTMEIPVYLFIASEAEDILSYRRVILSNTMVFKLKDRGNRRSEVCLGPQNLATHLTHHRSPK